MVLSASNVMTCMSIAYILCPFERERNVRATTELSLRQIRSLSHKLQECEDLLREVENFVPESSSQRIRALLNKGQDPTTEMGLGEQLMHDAGSVSSLSVGSVEGAEGQEAEQHTKHNEARQSLDSFGTNNMNNSNYKDFGAEIAKRVQTW
ncbi:hypothetical protein N7454_005534 [Penicillium verhagenii]|nr:hypothetical protein N7454_005534 [Penicillium verhagenii]